MIYDLRSATAGVHTHCGASSESTGTISRLAGSTLLDHLCHLCWPPPTYLPASCAELRVGRPVSFPLAQQLALNWQWALYGKANAHNDLCNRRPSNGN